MRLSSSTYFLMSSYSASSFCCSRPVRARSFISRMALACISVSEKRSIRRVRASSVLADDCMMSMTSLMFCEAMMRPSRMCMRSSALARRNLVRRMTTSWRWSMNDLRMSCRLSVQGRPLSSATLFIDTEACSCVILYSLFSTTLALASAFTLIIIRMPSKSVSSLMSAMPSSFFSFTSCAMYLMSSALLTP